MPFDLDTIVLHIDNFVTTWEGWGDVFSGLNEFLFGDDKDGGREDLSSELGDVFAGVDGLSSRGEDATDPDAWFSSLGGSIN